MEKIHILGPEFSTFVRSVRLYCEELAISYTVGTEINGKTIQLRSEELAKYHPFKKVPVLIYNDTAIFETTTICRFLDNIATENTLKPKDPLTIALIDEWSAALSIYIDNILIRQYFLEYSFPQGANNTVREYVIEKVTPSVIATLALLDKQIGDNSFFCGEFYSMADAILTPMLDYISQTPQVSKLFANTDYLLPYLSRMKQRASGKIVFK